MQKLKMKPPYKFILWISWRISLQIIGRKNYLPGNCVVTGVVCFQHLYFSLMQPEKRRRRTDAHYSSNIFSRVFRMLKAKLFHTSMEAHLSEKRKSKTLLVKQEISALYVFCCFFFLILLSFCGNSEGKHVDRKARLQINTTPIRIQTNTIMYSNPQTLYPNITK